MRKIYFIKHEDVIMTFINPKTTKMQRNQFVFIKNCYFFALSLLLILNTLPVKGFSQNQDIYNRFVLCYIPYAGE